MKRHEEARRDMKRHDVDLGVREEEEVGAVLEEGMELGVEVGLRVLMCSGDCHRQ